MPLQDQRADAPRGGLLLLQAAMHLQLGGVERQVWKRAGLGADLQALRPEFDQVAAQPGIALGDLVGHSSSCSGEITLACSPASSRAIISSGDTADVISILVERMAPRAHIL